MRLISSLYHAADYYHRMLQIDIEDIPTDLQRSNQEIAIYCIFNNLINADECTCFDSEDFGTAIQDGELKWSHLPQLLRNDSKFAASISWLKTNTELPRHLMEQILGIRPDKSYWRRIFSPQYVGDRHDAMRLFKDFAPAKLSSDHDFLLEICSDYTNAFSVIDENLASNRVFLGKVLLKNWDILRFLSDQTQILHRDLVLTVLPSIGSIDYVSKKIYPPFQEDLEFAMTWMKAGHWFPCGNASITFDAFDAWMNNRAPLCLTGGIYTSTRRNNRPLEYAQRFTGGVHFMVEVLNHRPEMYWESKDAAADDPICMTIAFAASLELTTRKMRELHFDGMDEKMKRYTSFLCHKLGPYEALFECILGNMLSTQSMDVTGSNLTLLNQGIETSINYKRQLVEYLDIPTRPWLLQLLQAERNVPFEKN